VGILVSRGMGAIPKVPKELAESEVGGALRKVQSIEFTQERPEEGAVVRLCIGNDQALPKVVGKSVGASVLGKAASDGTVPDVHEPFDDRPVDFQPPLTDGGLGSINTASIEIVEEALGSSGERVVLEMLLDGRRQSALEVEEDVCGGAGRAGAVGLRGRRRVARFRSWDGKVGSSRGGGGSASWPLSATGRRRTVAYGDGGIWGCLS